jgi:hypothetical protein
VHNVLISRSINSNNELATKEPIFKNSVIKEKLKNKCYLKFEAIQFQLFHETMRHLNQL